MCICFFTMLLTLFKRVKTTLCGYSRSDTITPPSESDLTKTWQTYSAREQSKKHNKSQKKKRGNWSYSTTVCRQLEQSVTRLPSPKDSMDLLDVKISGNWVSFHIISTIIPLPQDPYFGSRPICWIHRTRERNETLEYYVNCGHTKLMKWRCDHRSCVCDLSNCN